MKWKKNQDLISQLFFFSFSFSFSFFLLCRYEGEWDCGFIVGKGKHTIQVGHGPHGGPTEIVVKCFSF